MLIKLWRAVRCAEIRERSRVRPVFHLTVMLTLINECISVGDRNISIELRNWQPNRFVRCIFCLDYDDYHGLSVFGCGVSQPLTCLGNSCYMRQHKKSNFFLYTSGCLNFTENEYEEVSERRRAGRVVRGATGRETQLCEVSSNMNTCICNNNNHCNNISSLEPFTELTSVLFKDISFDELAHFRHFLPNDPLLREVDSHAAPVTSGTDDYFMIRVYNNRFIQVPSAGIQARCNYAMLISLLISWSRLFLMYRY